MESIVYINTSTPKEFVEAVDFIEKLSAESDIMVKRESVQTRGIEEIILTLISSSALIVIANALRDFAQRKKIHIQIMSESGNKVDIQAEGNDLSETSEIIGYLSNNKHCNLSENISKDIHEDSFEIKLQLKKD